MSEGEWCVLLGLVFAAFASGAFTCWLLGALPRSDDDGGAA